jgi:hypothetical protein
MGPARRQGRDTGRARSGGADGRAPSDAGAPGTPLPVRLGEAHSYAATTLAWAGDPAAERVARDVIAELEAEGARPRRIASARLDLGLALTADGKPRPDEAAAQARVAVRSGRIVPSNWWRVEELVTGVEQTGAAESRELREEAEASRPVDTLG